MIRYTSLGLFAVSVSPARFLTQGSVPVLDFVLSATQILEQPLAVALRADFALSTTDAVNLTLAV